MHEAGIMQDALNLARRQAEAAGAHKIHMLRMRVGALSGVEPDALAFAFEVMRQGTPAHDARLEVERVGVVCYCTHCQAEFRPDGWVFECPLCHALSAQVRHGRELDLVSLEVS